MSEPMQHHIHNPFYSSDVKEPVDANWAARRRVADLMRGVIEDLVTTTCETENLDAIAGELERIGTLLRQSPRVSGRTAYLEEEYGGKNSLASVGYELNPLDGRANPIAAPMKIWIDEKEAVAYADAYMGWQYEGPPHCLHGGMVAALFDQFLGVAQKLTHQPGVTGWIKVRYHKPTPLHTRLKLVGRVKSVEGRKNVLEGEMWAGDQLTASCEGLFIHLDIEAYKKMQEARRQTQTQ
jgi:hypothetical protein